jgi:adenylate cyclase
MPIPQTEPVEVRYYPCDGSVFLDTHYLIKGVAGSLFWKLAREHVRHQRCEFSTRELRLSGHELRLPAVQDNLSVRLLLLQRRLAERHAAMQIQRTGRGRFRIDVARPLQLQEVCGPASDVPAPVSTQPAATTAFALPA